MYFFAWDCPNCSTYIETEMELGSDIECPECGSQYATGWEDNEVEDEFGLVIIQPQIFITVELL